MIRPPLTPNGGIGLENFNIQIVMKTEFKIGLVIQSSGNGSVLGGNGSKHLPSGYSIPKCDDGKKVYSVIRAEIGDEKHDICITNKYDMEQINGLNLKNPDDMCQLGLILLRYDNVGSDFIKIAADNGSIDACLVIGISQFEEGDPVIWRIAKNYLQKAADNGNACGKCWLGRYFAEGKGCNKNKILAKKWLNEAGQKCSEADGYLDQYGLR